MFCYEGDAYVNAADLDWVKNETHEKEKCIWKIKNSKITKDFQNWDATVLHVGTEIYETDNDQILLAGFEDQLILYLKYVEG